MAHQERQEKQRNRGTVSANSSDQSSDAGRICGNDQGEAQSKESRQAVFQAAKEYHGENPALSLVVRYGFETDDMPGWTMTRMTGHHGAQGRVIWVK